MADFVLTKQTQLAAEEVITRAVQFFSTASWRVTSQTNRAVTFEGRVPIPWFMLLLAIIGFVTCLVPGIIIYFFAIRKVRRFQNLVLTASTSGTGTEVTAKGPPQIKKLVEKFFQALPQ